MNTIVRIEKEEVRNLKFSSQEVLADKQLQSIRAAALQRAQSLGNLEKNKVGIVFQDALGQTYRVETTVWALGADFVCLKADTCLPVRAILEVEI